MTDQYTSWTHYNVERPAVAGIYEWRVHSEAVPGMVLIVAAEMRMRGAGFETVLSPEFDYWDGYRVHVLCDVEWRPTDFVPQPGRSTPVVLAIEGLELSPCSRCGRVPTIEAHQIPASGGIVALPYPWKLNSWRLTCCPWGHAPRMDDPRDIERIRRETRCKCRPTEAPIAALLAERDAQAAEVERLREALQFYADQDHFNIADEDAWDTVSGEPQNFWCDEAGTATVEDGSIARAALSGESNG